MGQAEQQPEHRRLAGAVGADQTDPAARHVEREIVERGHARVALGEARDSEKGSGIHSPSLTRSHGG